MERKTRSFEYNLDELQEKLQYKNRLFSELKWKFDKASVIMSDSDTKKVIGIDSFKQKIEKFNLDLN